MTTTIEITYEVQKRPAGSTGDDEPHVDRLGMFVPDEGEPAIYLDLDEAYACAESHRSTAFSAAPPRRLKRTDCAKSCSLRPTETRSPIWAATAPMIWIRSSQIRRVRSV